MLNCEAILLLGVLIHPCNDMTITKEPQGVCRVETRSDKLWQIADFDLPCLEVNKRLRRKMEQPTTANE